MLEMRTFENRPGQVYDPTDLTRLFAEDINSIVDYVNDLPAYKTVDVLDEETQEILYSYKVLEINDFLDIGLNSPYTDRAKITTHSVERTAFDFQSSFSENYGRLLDQFGEAYVGIRNGQGFFQSNNSNGPFRIEDYGGVLGGVDSANYCLLGQPGISALVTTSSLVGKTLDIQGGIIVGFY